MTAVQSLSAKGEHAPITLSMMGDWGVANWHQLVGFIAAGLRFRTSPESRFVIHTIGPYKDTIDALVDGTCDLCISSPVSDVHMARVGRARFSAPHPELRGIGVYPHHDRLMLGLGKDVCERYGLRSFEDIAQKQPPLKLVTAVHDGVNYISWTAEKILNGYGIAWDDIPRWGGEWVEATRPHEALAAVGKGELDGIFFEALMNWHRLMERRPLQIFPIAGHVLDWLERDYGVQRGDIESGELPGVEQRTPVIDFSDWIVVVKEDLPNDTAFLIAETLIDDRSAFEKSYTHRPWKESPLSYPIEPRLVAQTGTVPLHPGARRFYEERGLLP